MLKMHASTQKVLKKDDYKRSSTAETRRRGSPNKEEKETRKTGGAPSALDEESTRSMLTSRSSFCRLSIWVMRASLRSPSVSTTKSKTCVGQEKTCRLSQRIQR